MPCACGLGDDIRRVVDDVGIVACATHEAICAGAAVEDIVAGVSGHVVRERIAGAVDRGGPGERQVLDISGKRQGHRALHEVGAFARVLGDDIAAASTT